MKKPLLLIVVIILASTLISGCAGGALTASSWPGIEVDSDTVFIASDTRVMAVRLSDGTLEWQFPANPSNKQNFYAPPAVGETQVVIGDYTNNLFSLDIQSGNQQWVFTGASGRFIGGALIESDSIYAPSNDNTLYALSLQGGQRWKFTTENALWAKPVSDDDNLYLASMDHHLYAINKENGDQVWSVDIGGAMVSSPLLTTDGILFVGSFAKEIVAIKAINGEVIWRFSTSDAVWSTPTLKDDHLYFSDSNGIIYSINARDGAPRWQLETGSVITASPAQYPDGLFFTTQSGELLAVTYDGKKLWSHTVGGQLHTTPLISNNNLVVASMGGDQLLVCFDLNGNKRWSFQPPK